MNQKTLKRQGSKGSLIAQSTSPVPTILQQDAMSRTHEYLRLKCAFATFVEGVEKSRQVLAGLSKELEVPGESLKKEAVLSLNQDILNELEDKVRASKLLIAQNSGGCPATPPSSVVDEFLLPE